jgi:toxin YoeB
MAKRRIEWSVEARNDLIQILEFYNERNASFNYSIKIYKKIQQTLLTISKNPKIGLQTKYQSVKVFNTGYYQIIYEIYEQIILVIMIWDCRRNPNDKRIGTRIKK